MLNKNIPKNVVPTGLELSKQLLMKHVKSLRAPTMQCSMNKLKDYCYYCFTFCWLIYGVVFVIVFIVTYWLCGNIKSLFHLKGFVYHYLYWGTLLLQSSVFIFLQGCIKLIKSHSKHNFNVIKRFIFPKKSCLFELFIHKILKRMVSKKKKNGFHKNIK